MRRTIIITITTEGENAWRVMDDAEEELLNFCICIADGRRDCQLDANICVEPLAQTLIDDLCNPPSPTVGHNTGV